MSYHGFGYSNYQYPPDNQDENLYSRNRAQSPVTNPGLQHPRGQDYQQYGWQSQNIPRAQSGGQRGDYGMKDSHLQAQSQSGQQRGPGPDTSSYQSAPGLGQNPGFNQEPSRGSMSARNNGSGVNSNGQNNAQVYYPNNTQDMSSVTAASQALRYQSSPNQMRTEPSQSPSLPDRARDAASTMTALSASLPSRSPHVQRFQQNNSSPVSMMNTPGQVSTAPAPRNTSPQIHQNRSQNMVNIGREATNTVPHQRQQQHEQQQLQQPQQPRLPDPGPAHTQTSPTHTDLLGGSGQPVSNPNPQYSQPTAPLPNFIDPTQIFNPYQREMEAAKQLEQEMEARARRKQEAEEEAARRREERAQRQREEQEIAEAEMRRHMEAMGHLPQSKRATNRSVPASTSREIQAETEENTTNTGSPPASVPKPQRKKRQPKGQKNKDPSEQGATTSQQTPRKKRGPKRKSESAASQKDNTANRSNEPGDSGSDADDIASEMQKMMQKMRKWESKDPALFASMLEDLKKGGKSDAPSEPQAHTQSPTTQQSTDLGGSQRKKSTGRVSGGDANKEVYTAEEPDLGKFPAARRKRRYRSKPQTSSPSQPPATATENNVPVDDSSIVREAPEAPGAADTSVSQPPPEPVQPQPTPKATELWPTSKRYALAQAASEYVNSLEPNKSKECKPSFIMELIEKNPSYIEICGMIESHCYSINRVQFAKHLLKSVPDLISSSQPAKNGIQSQPPPPPPPTSIPPVQSSHPPQPVPPSEFKHARLDIAPSTQVTAPAQTSSGTKFTHWGPGAGCVAAHQVPVDANRSQIPLPHTKEATVIPPLTPSHSSKLDPRLRVPAPRPHQPVPGTKEAMARKRNFSDIVDLTQGLSDEENMPPNKEPRVETDPVDQQQTGLEAHPATEPPSQPPKSVDLSKYMLPPTTGKQEALRRQADLVKRFNKAEAPRKTYYNPKTIARDILIASGRHPTERPLNQHLSKLKEKFHHVDNNADLRTFRWDIVDPCGPSPPDVEPELLPQAPPQKLKKPPRLHNPKSREESDADPGTESSANFKPSSLRVSQSIDDDLLLESQPEIMSDTTRTKAPSTPAKSDVRGPGRPPGSKNRSTLLSEARAQKVEVVVPPSTGRNGSSKHGVYECRWGRCDAKLHNLDVLRKHVQRIHLPDATACQWPGCGDGPVSQRTYTTAGLREHIESHLSDVAWHKGEGPNLGRSGRSYLSDLDACLNDDSGRPLIPRASTLGAPPTLILPAAYSSIRSFNKLRGNASDKAKAQEVLRALESKQAQVGVGVGKGGCTLMNPTRMSTVVAHEEVFDIVPVGD